MLEVYPDWFEDAARDLAEENMGAILAVGVLVTKKQQDWQMFFIFVRAMEVQSEWKYNSWLT
jgi:hypothetical protein